MHDLLHEGQLAAIHGGSLLVHGGGWQLSDLPSFHTGPPLTSTPDSDLTPHIHTLKRVLVHGCAPVVAVHL